MCVHVCAYVQCHVCVCACAYMYVCVCVCACVCVIVIIIIHNIHRYLLSGVDFTKDDKYMYKHVHVYT